MTCQGCSTILKSKSGDKISKKKKKRLPSLLFTVRLTEKEKRQWEKK